MGLRLGIDLDGVVVDFTGGWVNLYNRDFGAAIRVEEVVTWGAPKQMTHFATMGEFWQWAKSCGDGASLFRNLDPYPGAIEALHQLHADGHEIVILTTKPHFAISDTHEWIEEHGVPTSEVHILNDKAEVDCDVYVDDSPYNLKRLVAERANRCVVRYVRPWNSPMSGVKDAASWNEVRRIVAEYAAAST